MDWKDLRCGRERGYFCRKHGKWILCDEVAAGEAGEQHQEWCPARHYDDFHTPTDPYLQQDEDVITSGLDQLSLGANPVQDYGDPQTYYYTDIQRPCYDEYSSEVHIGGHINDQQTPEMTETPLHHRQQDIYPRQKLNSQPQGSLRTGHGEDSKTRHRSSRDTATRSSKPQKESSKKGSKKGKSSGRKSSGPSTAEGWAYEAVGIGPGQGIDSDPDTVGKSWEEYPPDPWTVESYRTTPHVSYDASYQAGEPSYAYVRPDEQRQRSESKGKDKLQSGRTGR